MTMLVLCAECVKLEPAAVGTDMYSVDGCDRCDNGGAGHQVYEPPPGKVGESNRLT